MGKSGVITEKSKENKAYHNVIVLFKIYRSVSWRMQVQIGQVKHRFRKEYGTDVDSFLESIYQAGMDLNDDEANIKPRVEAISSSNNFLKLIDESVELMRLYHPQGERYYWVWYYTYMTPHQLSNISEIMEKLEPHLSQGVGINRSTYFRWRDSALKAVEGILWGMRRKAGDCWSITGIRGRKIFSRRK